jgi:adenosylcobyric acid synthase
MGVTRGPDCARPFAHLADGAPEGAISGSGRVMGTYIHGLFAHDKQRGAWLERFGAGPSAIAYDELVESTLDRLAGHLEGSLDLDRLFSLARA